MKIITVTVEKSIEVPQKLVNRLPYDAVISLLGTYPKEMKSA
jgi:hypothetical protein